MKLETRKEVSSTEDDVCSKGKLGFRRYQHFASELGYEMFIDVT